MPLIPFPNVPKLPGVPQLLRSPNFPAAPPAIVGAVIAVGQLIRAFLFGTGWGIYKHQEATKADPTTGIETVTTTARRTPVVDPDSFLEFDYRNEWAVADYPVQDGSFASYDKVDNPYEISVRLSKGGSQSARQQFLDSIQAIAGDLNLYDLVTPEKTYLNVNITRFEVARRGARGAYMLTEVDVYFREIRFVTPQYTTSSIPAAETGNAQQPSARPTQNNGTVQGTAAPPLDLAPS